MVRQMGHLKSICKNGICIWYTTLMCMTFIFTGNSWAADRGVPEPHYTGICGNSNLESEEVEWFPGIILNSSSKGGVVNFPFFSLSQWDFSYALVG